MSYYPTTCDCSGEVVYAPAQCQTCPGDLSGSWPTRTHIAESTQKKIWNVVRVPSSLYTMNIGALNVVDVSNGTTNFTNWNQMSDRNLPSVQGAYHGLYTPSRGSSTKTSITRMRPGSGAPGGKGVDIKHNSYARYLARRKASNIRTQTYTSPVVPPTPLQGNKTRAYGIVTNSRYCLCFTN
jgi:hypothetical protein